MFYRYKLGEHLAIRRAITEVPQTLDELTDKVHQKFSGKDRNQLKSELESYCRYMEAKGFIKIESIGEDEKTKIVPVERRLIL
jgi:hypothetical protein